jgi:hypothetical protein
VPESAKFLIGKGKYDEARTSLRQIARINGVSQETISGLRFDQECANTSKGGENVEIKVTLRDLIQNREYLVNLCIAVFSWTACLLAYYTVYFHIRYLGGDFFINVLVFGTCEVSAYAIGQYFTSYIGNKKSLGASFGLAVISTIIYLVVRDNHPFLTPLSLAAAGFGIVWACNINWNGNALLFPVIYASSTNGICQLFSRFACIMAPQLAEFPQPYPMLIISVFCLVALILCQFYRIK